MERVNAFPTGEDWEFLDCIHNVALTLNCPDCKEWRADDPPAGEIAPDGPEVVRVRSVSRETETAEVFAEPGVWSPSAADYRRWARNGHRDPLHRYIPDWYGWEAEEATWD